MSCKDPTVLSMVSPMSRAAKFSSSRRSRSAADMSQRGLSLGLFGRFGRSAGLRELGRALRSVDLHPNLVPESVKLTTVGLLREHAHDAESAPDSSRAGAGITASWQPGAPAFGP